MNAGAQVTLRLAELAEFSQNVLAKFLRAVGPSIGEGLLGLVPDPLIRVQLGSVAGEVLDLQARVPLAELSNRIPLVDAAVVPQQDDWTAKVPQELPEESTDFRVLDVLLVDLVVEPHAVPPRADRQPGNDGDLVMPVPVANHRRVPARPPGSNDRPHQHEPRFIEEDEVGAHVCRPFFIRGHSSRFQRSMFSSFRSRARRSGFCTLQSSRRMRRPTWSL